MRTASPRSGPRFRSFAPRVLLLAGGVCLGGCLVTATVPDLGTVTEARPFILRDSVEPSPLRILEGFPSEFLVPVEVDGPSSSFQWRVYVDRDRKDASGFTGPLVEIGQTSEPVPLSAGAIRRIRFSLDAPATLGGGCALVEFFVARAFNDRRSPQTSPSAGPPDSLSWLVSTGPEGCAGIVADGGVDGGMASDAAGAEGGVDAR